MRFIVRGSAIGALLFLTVMLVAPTRAQAQTTASFFAGPTIASLSGDFIDENEGSDGSRVGFFVGGGLGQMFTESFGGFVGVAYSQKGTGEGDGEIATSYVSIPLLASYMVPINETTMVQIFAGPQLSILVGCEVGEDNEDCDDEVLTPENQFEGQGQVWEIVAGAEAGFAISESINLSIGAAFDFGLTDALEVFGNDLDAKSRTWYLFGGLSIPLAGGGM